MAQPNWRGRRGAGLDCIHSFMDLIALYSSTPCLIDDCNYAPTSKTYCPGHVCCRMLIALPQPKKLLSFLIFNAWAGKQKEAFFFSG
jgi:hypothetical protein